MNIIVLILISFTVIFTLGVVGLGTYLFFVRPYDKDDVEHSEWGSE